MVGWLTFIMGAGLILIAFLSGLAESASLILAVVGLALVSIGLVAGAGSQAIERRARSEAGTGYAGPSPFLVFAAALAVSLLAVAVVAAPLVSIGLDAQGPAAALLSVTIQTLIYVGLIRLLVVGSGSLGWRDMGIGGRAPSLLAEDIAWGAISAVPILVVTALIAAVLAPLLPLPDSPLPPSTGSGGFAFNLIAAAIMAPIGEELFFRGFATTAWSRSMSIRAAVLRGAVFFAAVHVLTVGGTDFADASGRALVAFVTRLPVSLALGALFVRRGSLAAPIALHATFNGLLVVLAEMAVRG